MWNPIQKPIIGYLDLHRRIRSCDIRASPQPSLSHGGALDATSAAGSLPQLVGAAEHAAGELRARLMPALSSLALVYLTLARHPSGGAADSVARFHLASGAILECIRPFGDLSENGYRQSYGLMVNYRYDPDSAYGSRRSAKATSAASVPPPVAINTNWRPDRAR